MTCAEEMMLVEFAKEMGRRQLPLERRLLMKYAGEMDGLKEKPYFVDREPSNGWWSRFRHRHCDISLRRPSKVHGGHTSMAKKSVFDRLFRLGQEV